MRKSRSVVSVVVLALLTAALAASAGIGSASADTGQNDVVGAVPSGSTPWINNGQVHAITQVGNTMVSGGTFNSVSGPGGTPTLSRPFVFAFDATTGVVSTAFNPVVNGSVESLAPGPTASTVYLAGFFTQINGQPASHVALLDLSTGLVVPTFKAPLTNGAINAIDVSGGRLLLGGYFTKIGTQVHDGLATLNPVTGALNAFLGVQLLGHHNNTGSGDQTSVGVRSMDVSSDGSRLIAVGNFTSADGLPRSQVVMVNLAGATAVVQADWNTSRYQPLCFSWAFDSTVRGVRFAPNGSWFVVTATGGHNGGTLCDTASRFETGATGNDIQPTWSADAGGDTVWGLAITDKVVYVGGHQRWLNDSLGNDFAGPGAVPRPGLGALDATSGVPLAWNPGRNPRGAGAYCLFIGSSGLWVGSDTPWIGNHKYKRPRIAFFPTSAGYNLPSVDTGTLPADVYLGGPSGGGATNVLYRVDAAGPAIQSQDGGPDWAADQSDPSQYRNSGSSTAGYSPVAHVDGTVPSSTPSAIFSTERWSPGGSEMHWSFPAPVGQQLSVRLYFANRYTGTSGVGQRVFNVAVDGTTVLPNFDIVAAAGDQTGTMRSFSITSDGAVNIDFSHVVENPLINGIEIVRTDAPPPPPPDGVTGVSFDGSAAGAPATIDPGGLAWSTVRGAFMLGSTLYYGDTDGFLYKRTFDGAHFGPATQINPYRDATWDGVGNGSGGLYNGVTSAFYGELANVTGMFFSGGRIYYTLFGQSSLYYRYFAPDSGIVGSDELTASGGLNWSDGGGMFVDSGRLYFVTRSTGALWSVPFVAGTPTGTPVDVNDPGTGGVNWNAHAVFIGPTPPPNQPPVARATVGCPDLACTFDGSTSSDADGTVSDYSWDFGDGTTGSGPVASHLYSAAGTYAYTLTVTDNAGATASTSGSVKVSDPSTSPIQYVGSAGTVASGKLPAVTVPGAAQSGDLLLLVADVASSTVTVSDPTGVSGWTLLGTTDAGGLASYVWWKNASPGDAGTKVTVPLSAGVKSSVQVLDYSGANATQPIDVFASSIDATTTASHATPTVNATSSDWVISLWADKSATTTQWTAPGAVTVRNTQIGTGSGFVSALAGDSGSGVGSLPYGNLTSTTDHPGAKGAMWTIAVTS